MLNLLLFTIANKTMLLILMVFLIIFLVLLTILGIVFIVALRKRAPVIKVVMAPTAAPQAQPEAATEDNEEEVISNGVEEVEPTPEELEPEPDEEMDEEEDASTIVTEGMERVRYDRSFTAKIIQMKDDSKEWYTQLKNELLSYQKVKCRTSWKKESFRLGRDTIARFVVRGKTICLLLAVEPAGFTGTKFTVEDVSNVATTADTPCLYRVKNPRRVKYAKELIQAVMKELNVRKDPSFIAQDYYLPYEGTMGLMERGLIKRVVTGSTRTFEIREVDESAVEEKVE